MSFNFILIGFKLAKILALIGIVWSSIQMALGTMEVRKFYVGIITKWITFLLIMSLLPGFSRGLMSLSKTISTKVSGASLVKISDALGDYFETLKVMVDKQELDAKEQVAELQKTLEKLETYKNIIDPVSNTLETANHYVGGDLSKRFFGDNFMTRYLMGGPMGIAGEILAAPYKTQEEKKAELERQLKDWKENNTHAKTYNMLKTLLVDNGKNAVHRYSLDLEMRDSKGNGMGYVSPAAIFKISILCAEMIWELEWTKDVEYTWNNEAYGEDKADALLAEKEANGYTKDGAAKHITKYFNFPKRKIFNVILALLICIILIFTVCASLIQYVACIVEYSIVSAFSYVLVPCMLFDGTKDMAVKVFPALIAQAVKLCMILLTMYFCLWCYVDLLTASMEQTGGVTFKNFAMYLFTCLMCFTITSNAPKLASALMTGQPQLSMGEFVQSAYAFMRGAKTATAGVTAAYRGGKRAVAVGTAIASGGATMGINAAGSIAEAVGAGIRSAKKVQETAAGAKSFAKLGKGFVSGFGGNIKEQFNRGFQKNGMDFLHGKKNGGAGSRGGSNPATNRYASTDPNRNYETDPLKAPRYNQNATATNFRNAEKVDANGNSMGSMNPAEFIRMRFNGSQNAPGKKDFSSQFSPSSYRNVTPNALMLDHIPLGIEDSDDDPIVLLPGSDGTYQ